MDLIEPYVLDPFPVPDAIDRVGHDIDEFLRLHLGRDRIDWSLDDGRQLAFNQVGQNPIIWALGYLGAGEPPHWYVIPFDGVYWVYEDEGRVEKWWDGQIVEERRQDGPGRIAIPF